MKRFQFAHLLIFLFLLGLLTLPEKSICLIKGVVAEFLLPLTSKMQPLDLNAIQPAAKPLPITSERSSQLPIEPLEVRPIPICGLSPLSPTQDLFTARIRSFAAQTPINPTPSIIWAQASPHLLEKFHSRLVGAAVIKDQTLIGVVSHCTKNLIAIAPLQGSLLKIPAFAVRGAVPAWFLHHRIQQDLHLLSLHLHSGIYQDHYHTHQTAKETKLKDLSNRLSKLIKEIGDLDSPPMSTIIASGLVTSHNPFQQKQLFHTIGLDKAAETRFLASSPPFPTLVGSYFVPFFPNQHPESLEKGQISHLSASSAQAGECEIEVGDLIVTSGYEGIYPPGITIAIVSGVYTYQEKETEMPSYYTGQLLRLQLETTAFPLLHGDTILIVPCSNESTSPYD
jgi:hypothetical protein